MKIEDILNLAVSRQDRYWKEITQCSLGTILEEIRSDRHINKTSQLRRIYETEDPEVYREKKKYQPVVTFCASFYPNRITEDIQDYNYLMIIDIDKLDKKGFADTKEQLLNEELVFSLWESTSGAGLKGLVHLDYTFDIEEYGVPAAHKVAFNQLAEHFFEKHQIELDENGKDITRLCFISYDKELVCKDRVSSFKVRKEDYPSLLKSKQSVKVKSLGSRDDLYNPASRNLPSHRREIKKIITYLQKKNLSITYSYDQWLRVAFAISKTFTYNVGLKYFLALSAIDIDKFDESECENLLNNVYIRSKGEINFGTIIYYAQKQGFIYMNN